MVVCLMARFLAISASNDWSKLSTSDNASAMARCSVTGGNFTSMDARAYFPISKKVEPMALSSICGLSVMMR